MYSNCVHVFDCFISPKYGFSPKNEKLMVWVDNISELHTSVLGSHVAFSGSRQLLCTAKVLNAQKFGFLKAEDTGFLCSFGGSWF